MEIRKVRGNIINLLNNRETDVIVHGCNCFHIMGSGVARSLNQATDGALAHVDKRTPYGDINKLGKFSSTVYNGVNIFNLYTQHGFGFKKGGVGVHWESFIEGMVDILVGLSIYQPEDKIVSIPYIGCGLAGGDEVDFWDAIEHIEERVYFLDECQNIILQVVEYREGM